MSQDNPLGCFECFCFGKSLSCEQSSLYWDQVELGPKEAYFRVADDGLEESGLNTKLNFKTLSIDSATSRIHVKSQQQLIQPFYWSLSSLIHGDQVTSYNGLIRFKVFSRSSGLLGQNVLGHIPLVVLQGNHRLVLYHFANANEDLLQSYDEENGYYSVRLHESQWKLANIPQYPVTRDVLMVALQKVQNILIRSSDVANADFVRLSHFAWPVATKSGNQSDPAVGVEQCRCPPAYSGSSCQDPGVGHYRKRVPNYLDSKNVVDLVGWSEPCQCYNSISDSCDRETGQCVQCLPPRTGPSCAECIKGFFGDPVHGVECRPCECSANSLSNECILSATSDGQHLCTNCEYGYTGDHCQLCQTRYWNNSGLCTPCNCSPQGSLSDVCHPSTGQCSCKPGMSGPNCLDCPRHHEIDVRGKCVACRDHCSLQLVRDVHHQSKEVDQIEKEDLQNSHQLHRIHRHKEMERLREVLDGNKDRWLATRTQLTHDAMKTEIDLTKLQSAWNALNETRVVEGDKLNDIMSEGKQLVSNASSLQNEIESTIEALNQALNNFTGLSMDLNETLEWAETTVNEVLKKIELPDEEDSGKLKNETAKCNEILGRAQQVYDENQESIAPLYKRLDGMKANFTDFLQTLSTIRTNITEVDVLNGVTRSLMSNLPDLKWDLKGTLEGAQSSLISFQIEKELIDNKTKAIILASEQLAPKMVLVAEKESSLLGDQEVEDLVASCRDHAASLEASVALAQSQFNQTLATTDSPLAVIDNYNMIANQTDQAAELVRQTKATLANITQDYQALDELKQERANSSDLFAQAQAIVVPPTGANRTDALDWAQKQVDRLVQDFKRIETLPQSTEIDQSPIEEIKQRVQEVKTKNHESNDKWEGIRTKSKEIDDESKLQVEQVEQNYRNLTTDIERMKRQMDLAQSKLDSIENTKDVFKNKMDDLKRRIMAARQQVASIQLSLTSQDETKEGGCVRSYDSLNLEPSFIDNIALYYATSQASQTDSLLLFMGNVKGSKFDDNFMALEMKDRKIRFLWNTGGGESMVEHQLPIETADPSFNIDEQWYKIVVDRMGKSATLSVQKVTDVSKPDPLLASATNPSTMKRLNLNRDSRVFIGGLPNDVNRPKKMETSSFSGCLYDVYLNNRRFGLWNYATTTDGCRACKEGATESRGKSPLN